MSQKTLKSRLELLGLLYQDTGRNLFLSMSLKTIPFLRLSITLKNRCLKGIRLIKDSIELASWPDLISNWWWRCSGLQS